ncbi:MAG: tetratricopeptide repeat protein [Candidatus Bruticola sp.]
MNIYVIIGIIAGLAVLSVIISRAFKAFIRRRLNYIFSCLVEEGSLDRAQSCFQHVIEAAPSFMDYNSTLLDAALDLRKVNSVQSVHNLSAFFNKIADIYLLYQPESSFANIFAAGIKKHSNPILAKSCIAKAIRRDSSLTIRSIGSIVARNLDNCLSALLAISALTELPNSKKPATGNVLWTVSLLQSLNFAGASHSAGRYLQKCLDDQSFNSVSRSAEAYALDCQAYIKQSLGQGMDSIASLTVLRTVDFYTPYLFFRAVLICLANHHPLEAFKSMLAVTNQPDFELPSWFGDILEAYIEVIAYITILYSDGHKEADPKILDIHLKNLKDVANSYHDIKYVQTLTADAYMCAGKYRQALVYLERAKRLPWSFIIEADDTDDQEKYEAAEDIINSLATFSLYGDSGLTMALYTAYVKIGDEAEALALAERRLRSGDFPDPLIEAYWLFCAARAALKIGHQTKANQFKQKANTILDNYSKENHICGEPIPHENLVSVLSSPRCFGPSLYHFLRGVCEIEQNNPEASCSHLQKALHEHPNMLSALRLLGQQACLSGNKTVANMVLDKLELFYTSVDDLRLMADLEKVNG